MTSREALQEASGALSRTGSASPRLDAEILLAHCLGKDRLFLLTDPQHPLTTDEIVHYRYLIHRRLDSEPIAYIIGRKPFWSLVLDVDRRVLIPRPETELLVEEVLKILASSGNVTPDILDVGTGSGAIALALAASLPRARLTATDLSLDALAVACGNAKKAGLAHRVAFVAADMFEPFGGTFDIVVSNPPYIAAEDYDALPPDVRDFEPRTALWGGPRGLINYETLARDGERVLRQGGCLCLETGSDQAQTVSGMLRQSGAFDEIRCRRDYAGLDRVVLARRG